MTIHYMTNNIIFEESLNQENPYLYNLSHTLNHIDGFKEHKDYDSIFTQEKPLRVLYVNLKKGLILSIKDYKIKVYNYDKNKLLKILENLKTKLDEEEIYNHLDDVIKKYKVYLRTFKKSTFKEIIKEKRGEQVKIKEGTILYTSWGYDQTNTEYFKVKRIIGKNYFIVEELSLIYEESGSPTYDNVNPGEVFGFPQKAYISNDGYISICEYGYKRSLYLWDGESKYKTNSQFGH